MQPPPAPLFAAATPDAFAAAGALFDAYAAALPIDLGYQGYAAERASLPGAYAPPSGVLLLASALDGAALGCVALRPFGPAGCCEMKRLYVAPAGRGHGLGHALVRAVLAEAVRIGYREMRLDTLPSMTEALGLYATHGFERIPAYYDTPVAETIFLQRFLPAA